MIENSQKNIAMLKKNDMIYLKYKCPYCHKLMFKYTKHSNLKGIQMKCGRCKNIINIK